MISITLISFKNWGGLLWNLLAVKAPFKEQIPYQLALGCLFYAFLLALLGHFLPLFKTSFIFISILVGEIFFLRKKKQKALLKGKPLKIFATLTNRPLSFFMALYFLSGLIFTSFPSDYPDPLNYHLYGPLLWHKMGVISSLDFHIPLGHHGVFDYLYLFPFSLCVSKDLSLGELISLQICAQWIHFTCGLFTTAFLLIDFLKRQRLQKDLILFYNSDGPVQGLPPT